MICKHACMSRYNLGNFTTCSPFCFVWVEHQSLVGSVSVALVQPVYVTPLFLKGKMHGKDFLPDPVIVRGHLHHVYSYKKWINIFNINFLLNSNKLPDLVTLIGNPITATRYNGRGYKNYFVALSKQKEIGKNYDKGLVVVDYAFNRRYLIHSQNRFPLCSCQLECPSVWPDVGNNSSTNFSNVAQKVAVSVLMRKVLFVKISHQAT